MTERSAGDKWVIGYIKAWASDEREDIEALFTEDATYFTEPYAEPWAGRAEIVESWLEASDAGQEWSFEYEIVAETEDVLVVRAVTVYSPCGDEPEKEYHNLWVIRLAPDGRAREFTEWWMRKKVVPLPETIML